MHDPIQHVSEIALNYIKDDVDRPINPYKSPDEIRSLLDLSLDAQGKSSEAVLGLLEQISSHTPRSTSKRFYNQLFGGRDPVGTAADMLVPVLNSSIYTYKAAGPMTIIEETVIEHMARTLGFQTPGPQGLFTPGGSISNLLGMLLARNNALPEFRNAGSGGKVLTCYASSDSHYSNAKNAGILGIGRGNVSAIACDSDGRMDPSALRDAIQSDTDANHVPCCIIATSGTTVLGAFDPINEIASIAREFGIWLHVDASFGGAASLSTSHKNLLNGIEQADSVAWNIHKVLGVPLSAAAFFTKEPNHLGRSLDETADYLFQGDEDRYNPGTRSIQCGRRNDALKVWAAWKHHGNEGFSDRIDRLIDLAQYCATQIREHPDMTLSKDPAYVNVCFEVNGKSSRAICDALRDRDELLVGHATVDGRRIIRVPFVNGDLTRSDVDEMLGFVLEAAKSLPDGENQESDQVNARTGEACPSCGS